MAQTNIHNRQVYAMDNIDVLRAINSASVDLIYLDPPFNKKKEFVSPLKKDFFKDMAEEQKKQLKKNKEARFKDIFTEDDAKLELALEIKERHEKLYNLLNSIKQIEGGESFNFWYLVYMAIRLIECHRVLKKTGSIYLHCDPTMSHYLKLVMDCIFGEKNFRNEIIWERSAGRSDTKSYARIHDVILYYVKSGKATWNQQYQKLRAEYIDQNYRYQDARGRYATMPLKGEGVSGQTYEFKWEGIESAHWRFPLNSLKKMNADGLIHWSRNKQPRRKFYLSESKGVAARDILTDIPRAKKEERTGYPTQKPLALLKRIIKASTEEGDIVLDPFCGCATAPVAAEILNRQWVGIDLEPRTYHLVVQRLKARPVQKELAANKRGDKCDWDKLCSPESEPPPRAIDPKDQRHVYIVSNPAWDGKFKIGVAGNLDTRLKDYQTSSPYRDFKYEHYRETDRFFECERHIIKTFKLNPEKDANGEPKVKGEWVVGDLDRIRNAIDNFIDQGD